MKIGYIETFPLLGKDIWQKIPLEVEVPENFSLDATDEEIEAVMKKVRRIQYALKKQVESFFYESNAAEEKRGGVQSKSVIIPDEEINKDFELVKKILSDYPTREAAQAYLDTTGFHLNIECKNIVNSKTLHNEKK